MNAYVPLIIGLTIIAIVGVTITLARQRHGESSARLDDPTSDSMLRAPGSRPGGPGQAGQAVVGPGEIAPRGSRGRLWASNRRRVV